MKIVNDGIARNSVHKLSYKDGATALKDLAPSIESNFSLSGSSNKVSLALRLYEDFTLQYCAKVMQTPVDEIRRNS